ncbi:MAG: ArsA family ATPase, partial [Dehalococcoidia bacterium]|nr:ArsA family ATPase [Dehalococcoidia bacterium]
MTEIKPKHVTMFSGKGGVGKTTTAGATALHYALMEEPTLIISTDPTPSLSHIFEVRDKQKPVRVLDNLYLAELGLDEVKAMWDKKFGREVHEVFSSFVAVKYEDFINFMSSILPGLADEFIVDYIRELSLDSDFAHIVWDTAPMGQTLGLLETPTMLREHLRPAPRIYSRLKLGAATRRPVIEILKGWEQLSWRDMEFLRQDVRFALVTIAEALAVEQLDGILAEMAKYEFRPEMLIVNNVIKETGTSAFLIARADQQKQYLEHMYSKYSHLQIVEIPLFPHEIKGVDRLRLVAEHLFPRR